VPEHFVNTLNIIGCGRAAGSLARLWNQDRSVQIGGILNRSPQSSGNAVKSLGTGTAIDSYETFEPADCWLIGTSDEQIATVALELSHARSDLDDCVVFHLCGRHGTEILSPLAALGCRTAAVHPVRSLTHEEISSAEFAGTACIAEGGKAALEVLGPLFSSIGGVWLPVKNIDRGLYHAALSIISNVTKGVTWKAQTWLESAGLEPEMAAALSHKLLAITMEDLARAGAMHSITGPIVRGDTSTVAAHIEALEGGHPGDVEIYRILARTVLELAMERGDLDEAALKRFKLLLIL
jgi:predicted short-subunit dehydrogenase-like oxidoreductase (DUF2520 family)